MVNTTKSNNSSSAKTGFSPQALLQTLSFLPKGANLWVGYSGGCDSHVLLHALAAIKKELQIQLRAVYVNHGLSPHAVAWGEHCLLVCDRLEVPLRILSVDATANPGQGPEASARYARYQAISGCLNPGDYLCTAHHQDDQAETLLLQLLRGAGPKGLAAMPQQSTLGRAKQTRPLLDFTREQLQTYGEQHGLKWIDDESNLDTAFDRNFLRHELMPMLQKRWPSAARTLTRSASHCAEAEQLLGELAQQDYENTKGKTAETLTIEGLSQLSNIRLKNLLRYWIGLNGLPLPSDIKLQHVVSDVLPAAQDKAPCVTWRGAEVRRFDGMLYIMQAIPQFDSAAVIPWHDLDSELVLPDGRRLSFDDDGQSRTPNLSRLKQGKITIRFRQGGERITLAGGQHHKTLKQLFQEKRVPPWQRSRVPLVYKGDSLVAAAGVYCSYGVVICHPANPNHL